MSAMHKIQNKKKVLFRLQLTLTVCHFQGQVDNFITTNIEHIEQQFSKRQQFNTHFITSIKIIKL